MSVTDLVLKHANVGQLLPLLPTIAHPHPPHLIHLLTLPAYLTQFLSGVESQWGTSAGDEGKRTSKNGGYEYLRVATIQHAMVDQLRNPSPGFEEAIRRHFTLKRARIISVTQQVRAFTCLTHLEFNHFI